MPDEAFEDEFNTILAAAVAGARGVVTFDRERDITKHCFCCGRTVAPRQLVVVGIWLRSVGNRGKVNDPIRRPLCESCVEGDGTEDVRPVPPPWAELVGMVDGARQRGFSEPELEYFRSVLGLVWTKAFRAGQRKGGIEDP
jgi:hypothetical protein